MTPRILWLVPARSGSKGLPGKNVRLLGGLPLLAWRILCARYLEGEIWLSTDSREYIVLGNRYGAKSPFLRPKELSSDEASSVDVCLHAMRYAETSGKLFDILGLLQPTSPFVSVNSLRLGLRALIAAPSAHGAVAVCAPRHPSFFVQPTAPTMDILAERLRTLQDCRRQAIPTEITPCGGFYLVRWTHFLANPTFFADSTVPVCLNELESLDIDTELDFSFAEFLVTTGRVAPPKDNGHEIS